MTGKRTAAILTGKPTNMSTNSGGEKVYPDDLAVVVVWVVAFSAVLVAFEIGDLCTRVFAFVFHAVLHFPHCATGLTAENYMP